MSFASMVGVANTRPVETYVVRVIDAVTTYSMNMGMRAESSLLTTKLHSEDATRYVLAFKLSSDIGTQDANIQITVHEISGEARIHSSQGFPDSFKPLLHDLPKLALGGQDTSGVQAVRKGDPAQSNGRSPVVGGAPTGNQTDKAIAQSAVALFDIATIQGVEKEEPRRYLGASGIGKNCNALHALTLRGFPGDQPSPQLIRIFSEGHRIEAEVVAMLKRSGHLVREVDESTGKQFRFSNFGGHHMANLDGLITPVGTEEAMTLEIKSMNRDKFKAFQTKGVKLSHPDYYDQVIDGLGLAREALGDVLSKCFFVAYCKDNSQYHVEIVEFDQKHYVNLTGKATAIIRLHGSERQALHRNEYDCQQCFKRTSCWEPDVQERHCSHCKHAIPNTAVDDGRWACVLRNLTDVSQPCSSFQLFRPRSRT